MGAFYDGKCPPEFVLKGINGFGCDDARDLPDGVLLGNKHFVRSVFGRFGRHRSDFASGEGGCAMHLLSAS
jgi:hypothetical protein